MNLLKYLYILLIYNYYTLYIYYDFHSQTNQPMPFKDIEYKILDI